MAFSHSTGAQKGPQAAMNLFENERVVHWARTVEAAIPLASLRAWFAGEAC
jgi:hypothetical protein